MERAKGKSILMLLFRYIVCPHAVCLTQFWLLTPDTGCNRTRKTQRRVTKMFRSECQTLDKGKLNRLVVFTFKREKRE